MIPAKAKGLLKNHSFLQLWANHALEQVAYNMVNFALIIWVFELTKVNLAVSLWILAFLIPSVSLSLVAGTMADNFDRKKIIIATDILWGLVVLCFIFARESFPLILLVTFIAQGIDEFFFPSQNAILPRIVKKDELLAANSLFSLTITVAVVVGFLLAGPLLRFFGYRAPFVLATCFVLLGAFLVSFLPPIEAKRRRKPLPSFSYFKREIKDEFRLLAQKQTVFTTGLFLALLYGGMGAAGAVAPGFMEQGLKIDARDLSFVGVVPVAFGLIFGTSLVGKFGNRWGEKKMIKGGLLVFGLALLLLAASPALRVHFAGRIGDSFNTVVEYSSRLGIEEVPLAFERLPGFSLLVGIFAFTLGVALTFITVPVTVLLQRITPDQARGRTFGTFGMLTSTFTAFFVIAGGVIADIFNPTLLIASVGASAVLFAFLREQILGLVFALITTKMRKSS